MYTQDSSAGNTAITDLVAFRNGQPQKNLAHREVSQEAPWFAFYVGDVFRRTEDMDAAQFGAYISLLMYYWNHSRLPDDCDLQRVARAAGNGRAWRAMKDKVLSRVRLDLPTLDEQKTKARARSRKGKGAASARWDANA